MKNKIILLIVVMCMFMICTIVSTAQNNYIPGKTVSKKYGPFKIGFPSTKTIFVEIINYKADDPRKCNWGDSPDNDYQTVITMKVTSEKGETLYQVNYPVINENDSINLYPKQINLPDEGALLLICTNYNPSAEGTGADGQFYCINQYGSFIPVTGTLCPGNENEIRVVEQKISGETIFCYESLLSTGNFDVIQYYEIYLDGIIGCDPVGGTAQPITMTEYPVRINDAEAEKQRQNGVINLYVFAGKSDEIEKIKVSPKSKVKFLGAKYIKIDEQSPWWLHVSIDGETGYINNRKEIAVIGLPFIYREWDSEP